MKVFGVILAFGLSVPCLALAEDDMRVISVTGTGSVTAEPDMARIQMGVTHQAKDASAAMAQAAEGAAAVLARVTEAGIEPRDVQTSTVQLNPIWSNYRSSDKAPEITGFVARISVMVRVRDLNRLGQILDVVVQDGANELGGIQFGFAEPEPLMDDARRQAVAAGRARAELLADAAGVTLGPLQSLNEQGAAPRPVAMEMRASAADAGIPIAPGEMSLTASVSMVYRIAD